MKRKRFNALNEHLINNAKNEGYVYIGFLPEEKGVYKIGRTKNLQSRLAALKHEYGNSFCFYYFSNLLYNNVRAEEYLHDQQDEPVLGLEWFELGNLGLECVVADMHRLEKESNNIYEHLEWEKALS